MDWLFDTQAFVTRDRCGAWGGTLPVVYQMANVVIALAYYIIPAALLWLYRRRSAVMPRPGMLLWFSGFIFLCGTTHVMDFLAFHWPAYRLFTAIELLTACVSLISACLLPGAVLHIASLRTPAELEAVLQREKMARDATERANNQLSVINHELSSRIAAMKEDLAHIEWRTGIRAQVESLKEHLKKLSEVTS